MELSDYRGMRRTGALVGVTLGLAITLILYLRHESPSTSATPSVGPVAIGDRPSQDGVKTLGDDPAAPKAGPAPMRPRAEALIMIGTSRMQFGDLAGALKAILAIEPGPNRDVGLEKLADQLVPSTAQVNLSRLGLGADWTRVTATGKVRDLIRLADLGQGGLIRSRLLLRAAMVMRAVDEARPAAKDLPANDLDPPALLARAEAIALGMPADEVSRIAPFQWIWGIILSGALGLIGFFGTHMVEPLINVLGAMLTSFFFRKAGAAALAEKIAEKQSQILDKAS